MGVQSPVSSISACLLALLHELSIGVVGQVVLSYVVQGIWFNGGYEGTWCCGTDEPGCHGSMD